MWYIWIVSILPIKLIDGYFTQASLCAGLHICLATSTLRVSKSRPIKERLTDSKGKKLVEN